MNSNFRFFLSALMVTCSLLSACDDEKSDENSGALGSELEKEEHTKAKSDQKAKEASAAEPSSDTQKSDQAAGGKAGAECLAGKWHYDFADDALETMMKNLPSAKVTKEEGEVVCDITVTGGSGNLTCATSGGKPVNIEVTADQTGLPLSMSIKMSGKTTSKFKLLDEHALQIDSEGFDEMRLDVKATLAGKEFPFPANELMSSIGGEAGTTSDFECKGDELKVRPRIEGQSSWQVLKRMK